MKRFFIIELLVVVALIGVFLLGNGLVGMVVLDEHTRPLCEMDEECLAPDVCCFFAGENAGVCHSESLCEDIALLTRSDAERQEAIMQYPDVASGLWFQILTGALIIMMVGYSYFEFTRLKKER